MESLSRPFHRKTSSATFSKKLTNATSFSSAKGAYDDVFFSGGQRCGAPTSYSSPIEDYNEIFGGSRGSSIPTLDLSVLDEQKVSADVRGSKPDYLKIFGGFRDEDIALSYEEMFEKPKGAKSLSNEARDKKSKRLGLMDSNFRVSKGDAPKAGPKDCSPSFSDEEVDGNSAAAASVAALKKALEKAQASIRIAKELMERKKDGCHRFSKPKFKDGLDRMRRREDKVTIEAGRIREKNAKEKHESADVVLHVFTNSEREKARRSCKIAPDFKENKEVFMTEEVVGEATGNKSESTEDCDTSRQFSELAKAGEATLVCELADGRNNIMPSVDRCGCGKKEMETTEEILEQLDRNDKEVNEGQELEDLERKEIETDEKILEHLDRTGKKVDQHAQELKDLQGKLNGQDGLENLERKLNAQDELVDLEGKLNAQNELEDLEGKLNAQNGLEVLEGKLNVQNEELEDLEGKLNPVQMVQDREQHVCKLDGTSDLHKEEQDGNAGVSVYYEQTEEKQYGSCGQENGKKKVEEFLEPTENSKEFPLQEGNANISKNPLHEVQVCMENVNKQEEVYEEKQNKVVEDVHREEEGESLRNISEQDETAERPEAAFEWVDYADPCEVESNEKRPSDDIHENENSEKILDKIYELDISNKRIHDALGGEEGEEIHEDDSNWEGGEKIPVQACEYEDTESIQREKAGAERIEETKEVIEEMMNLSASSNGCKQDAGEILSDGKEAHGLEGNDDAEMQFKENERISDVTQSSCELNEDENGLEAVEMANVLGGNNGGFGLVGHAAEYTGIKNRMKDASESLLLDENQSSIGLTDKISVHKQTDQIEKEYELASNMRNSIKISMCESGEDEEKFNQDKSDSCLEEVGIYFNTSHGKSQWVEMGNKMEKSRPPGEFKMEEKIIGVDGEIKTTENTKKNEENLGKTLAVEEKGTNETAQKEMKTGKECLRKNEANYREREREKGRIAVERAIREARERAFAEARERAERAAVERATAEVRQRVMTEAREKLKAYTTTKSSADKASAEAKLRAERAAVERATAEARERALEKALSQKATPGPRDQAERSAAEKFSGVSKDDGMRHSIPPKLDANNSESAQRRKAKLERHQRTMERAAKALAEKNFRDLLAQKEQAERNRLAETLDSEVKRWSSGKEGNLRALLSTLQYILGPDSGWQPISLTEIVTTNAVKKAYRKATLHVHPDKLQQRGASIQQKYICEKVFDLLKAAWNKFNSEER
ncbi:auxilin-like protein 1 isoform X2 [Diospyros lotus]|uniref:auxilin-like protein 1 isoform X2 n=1 Tax=Diospyros lotus TaxID=55363 RepID=UPI00224C9296|nr:auxilin-like protein 1 isoform X2 [Diospyros lotus]